MASIADVYVVAYDNVTNRVFTPKIVRQGIAQWRETSKPVLEAAVLTLSDLPVKKGSGAIRKRIGFYQPIMETPANANSSGYQAGPKVAFPISWNIDWTTHARASEAQNNEAKKALLEICTFSGTRAVFNDAIVKDIMPV